MRQQAKASPKALVRGWSFADRFLSPPTASLRRCSGMASLFNPSNQQALSASFNDFIGRPENEDLVLQVQKKEVRDLCRVMDRAKLAATNEQVGGGQRGTRSENSTEGFAALTSSAGRAHCHRTSEYPAVQVERLPTELQANLEPFMRSPCLRRVVQTLANDPDPEHGLDYWSGNPRVLQLLQHAKELLDEGRVTEKELEQLLITQFKVGAPLGDAAGGGGGGEGEGEGVGARVVVGLGQ